MKDELGGKFMNDRVYCFRGKGVYVQKDRSPCVSAEAQKSVG